MPHKIANLGKVVGETGPQGAQGVAGPAGLTAYQAAVLYENYQGTQEQLYRDIADVGAIRCLLRQIIGEAVPETE